MDEGRTHYVGDGCPGGHADDARAAGIVRTKGDAVSTNEAAEAAPPQVVVYRDPEGGFADEPPPGKLDGWEGRWVYEESWHELQFAAASLDQLRRRLREVEGRHAKAREVVLAEWEDGR